MGGRAPVLTAGVTVAAAGERVSTRSFWLVVSALMAMMIAAGAPTPLYTVYSERIGFSAVTLTVIFAIYVVALLATLLVVGSLSDFVGRRPVLLTAMVVEIASLALFLPADSVGWLILARTVQGIATGGALGALGAAMVDTQRPGSQLGTVLNSVVPPLGLAIGALGASVLVEYVPDPTRLVFWILIATMVAAFVGLLAVPEPGVRRPGALASLRPDVRVDGPVRTAFLAAVPVFIATWAVGGIYMSLGPSLAVEVFGLANRVTGGVVVAALTASGAVASYLVQSAPPRRTTQVGSAVLIAGLLMALAGILFVSTPLFLLGSVVTGLGFGGSFLGALRSVMVLVGVDNRAATLSAVLTVSYLAFSVPAIIAGYAATRVGLSTAAIWYGVAVIVITLASVTLDRLRSRRDRGLPRTA
jgi:predicted MFS family arabinose efflux permease